MSKMKWLSKDLEDLSEQDLHVAHENVRYAMDMAPEHLRAAYGEDLREIREEQESRGGQ